MARNEPNGSSMGELAIVAAGAMPDASAVRAVARGARTVSALDVATIYEVLASRLGGTGVRIADLGAGRGEGASALARAGYAVLGVDVDPGVVRAANAAAPSAAFVCSAIEQVDLAGYDALLLVDVLGHTRDDAALLRSIAQRVPAGTQLLGAVARADVEQRLTAPARRAYSRESLAATLARGGWHEAVIVAQTREMILFEASRAASFEGARALELAESAALAGEPRRALELVALAAGRAVDVAEASELLLALGELHLALGGFGPAEQAATAANAIAPECAAPYVLLARLAMRTARPGDAEALLDHALGCDATSVAAWRELADLSLASGESGRAAEALEFAAALSPDDVRIARELAQLLASRSDADGAAAAMERALAYNGATDAMRSSFCWLGLGVATEPAAWTARRGSITGAYPVVRNSFAGAQPTERRGLAS